MEHANVMWAGWENNVKLSTTATLTHANMEPNVSVRQMGIGVTVLLVMKAKIVMISMNASMKDHA